MNKETGSTGVKGKWKRGLSQLRRQSVDLSHSPDCPSIMEEDEDKSEKEMQDYLTKLKKKTGLNMLWSGRKFSEAIDRDPDIDLSEPVSILRSTLKDMTLDSDEEDLQKFIQNLTDDEEEVAEEEESISKSSEGGLDLMKNINFAEVAAGEYKLGDIEPAEDFDFMPRIVQPKFQDDSDEHTGDPSSSDRDVFRGNIKFIDSDQVNTDSDTPRYGDVKSVMQRSNTISEIMDDVCTEEIDDSNVSKSLMKSTSEYNYTDSKFESFDSEAIKSNNQTLDRIHTSDSRSSNRDSLSRSYSTSLSSPDTVRASPDFKEVKNDKLKSRKHRQSSSSRSSDSLSYSKSSKSYDSSQSASNNRSKTSRNKSASSRNQSRNYEKEARNYKEESRHSKRSNKRSCSTQTKPDLKNDYAELVDKALLRDDIASKYLDPTPIAATVASSDAIEAVTSYNPSVLALNDLLKYQLQLTRQHIDNSWRLYKAYTAPETIGTHKYTTLKDTMKFIKKNAPSVISYEEALKQIENGDV